MSFKIWNAATVGGNVVMSLPAGAMISLTAALEGVCNLWPRSGKQREVPVVDFVTGNHANVLEKGELLRSIFLPNAALTKRFAMRQVSLTHLGRSAALIIATVGDNNYDFLLTITAATPRPVHIRFTKTPSAAELRQAIDDRLPPGTWFDDVHGSAAYKRHVTFYLAEQIRAELS
jgi:CO/xanthine dehydrogenase FAD-binding subunit